MNIPKPFLHSRGSAGALYKPDSYDLLMKHAFVEQPSSGKMEKCTRIPSRVEILALRGAFI